MKKILAVLIGITALLSTINALAANELTIDAGVEKVKITAVLDAPHNPLTLKVFKLLDNDGDGVFTDLGNLIHIDQLNAPTSGTATYQFDEFPTPTIGHYRAYAGGNLLNKDFAAVTLNEKRAYYRELTQKTASNIRAHIISGKNNGILSFNIGGYENLQEPLLTKVNTALADINYPALAADANADAVDAFIAAVKPLFEEVIAIADILNVSASDFHNMITTEPTKTQLGFDLTYYEDSKCAMNPETVRTQMMALNPDFSLTGLKKAFNTANLITLAKTCDYGILTEALNHYNNNEGVLLDTTYTAGMSQTALMQVSIEMKKYAASFNNASDIQNAYLAASGKVAGIPEAELPIDQSGFVGGDLIFSPPAQEEFGDVDSIQAAQAEMQRNFDDLGSASWAVKAINYLADEGVLTGKAYRKYYPDDSVTREEFVKIIISGFDLLDEEATCEFKDVEKGRWSEKYIASALALEIVTGTTDEEFSPTATLTREQMAAMIYRVYSKYNDEKPQLIEFADNALISDYAKEPIGILAAVGIVNGMDNNNFSPKGVVTRAQAAKIVYETLAAIGKLN